MLLQCAMKCATKTVRISGFELAKPLCLAVALVASLTRPCLASQQPIVVGSKKFTESYVLAEIAKRALETAGLPVQLRPGMGGTIILWEAPPAFKISHSPSANRRKPWGWNLGHGC